MATASFIVFHILGLTNNQNLLLLMLKTALKKLKISLRQSITNMVILQILSILQLRQCKRRFKILKLPTLIADNFIKRSERLLNLCWTTKLSGLFKTIQQYEITIDRLSTIYHYNIPLPINNYLLYLLLDNVIKQ